MNRVDNITQGMEDVRALSEVEIPSLKGKVSDTDTWHLVNYVRSLGGVKK